tara:strand:- start:279 stop:1025 length:747 start_codon:yes stop_codon:yes gene_type:complete
MSVQNLTPLAAVGAAFSAWAPEGALPASFALHQGNPRWQDAMVRGKGWLEASDADALRPLLAETLDGPQSACLYANMVSLFAVDDYSGDGKEILDELRKALLIDDRDARSLMRSMEILTRSNVIRERDEWVLCAAALMALSMADGIESEKESNYLARLVAEKAVIEDARNLFKELKAEGVLEKVSKMGGRQRKFLAANLLALMFADGEYHHEEQEQLDKFAHELFIMRSELEDLMKATYTMFNLSVFD